jgi:uncharacterized membrane protein
VPLPTWVFEVVVTPIAAALAFDHARRALGARHAAGELAALAAYGFTVEAVAMTVFGSHEYDASWRLAPLGVPLAIAVVWAAVITSAMAVAGRHESSRGWRAFTAAVVAIALDLMIDPVATRAGLWDWTPPGPWLGVPIGNFVAWGLIVGVYTYGAELWPGTGRTAFQPLRRLALAAACIVVLVLVATAWTSLGLERAFADGRGWAVWAAIQVATLWRMLKPQADREAGAAAGGGRRWGVWGGARRIACAAPTFPPSLVRAGAAAHESSLPARLAATPGRLPEAVLCVVGLAFAVEAVRIAEPGITVAAAGSLATIGVVVAAARRRRPAATVATSVSRQRSG